MAAWMPGTPSPRNFSNRSGRPSAPTTAKRLLVAPISASKISVIRQSPAFRAAVSGRSALRLVLAEHFARNAERINCGRHATIYRDLHENLADFVFAHAVA